MSAMYARIVKHIWSEETWSSTKIEKTFFQSSYFDFSNTVVMITPLINAL